MWPTAAVQAVAMSDSNRCKAVIGFHSTNDSGGSDAAGHGRYSSPFAEIKLGPVPVAAVRGLAFLHAARERDRCRTGLRSSQRDSLLPPGQIDTAATRHARGRPQGCRCVYAKLLSKVIGNDFPIVLPVFLPRRLQSYQTTDMISD